jgi:hypothetical protein
MRVSAHPVVSNNPPMVDDAPDRPGFEWVGASFLLLLGVGARVGFALTFPTLPFWDFLQIVHFGALLRDQGLFASGWYWVQFNPGLPVVLSVIFRVFPGDTIAVARMATAVATGLVALLPFFLWRPVLAFRWRLLAGTFLALWPGQVFFSGAVALDNWVLPPAIALASLAVRRLLDPADEGHPFAAGLLYCCAFAIRQEMAVVLLPAVLAAAVAPRQAGRTRRNLALLGVMIGIALLMIGSQRRAATGRFRIGSEHGALGLLGTFVPGASVDGWIDPRAYAVSLDPSVVGTLYGNESALLRLTWAEAMRRPAFHLVRIGAWIPRLALGADADNLFWSVGASRAQTEDRREPAHRFRDRWAPLLRWELVLVQGLFVATVALGLRRRNPAILLLASTVLLKFLIHALVAPVGRAVVPAIALELLTIPLGLAALATRPGRARLDFAALAAAAAALLFVATPALTALVLRHDSPVLPGVRRFALRAGPDCEVQCEVESGAVTGMTPTWVRLQTAGAASSPTRRVRISCALPVLAPDDSLLVRLSDFGGPDSAVAMVAIDGRESLHRDLAASPASEPMEVGIFGSERPVASNVTVELRAPDAATRGPQDQPAFFSLEFVRPARTIDAGGRPVQ